MMPRTIRDATTRIDRAANHMIVQRLHVSQLNALGEVLL
jgi:hypothetical protein